MARGLSGPELEFKIWKSLQDMDSIYQFDRGSASRVAGILIGWVLLTQKGIGRSRKREGAILGHDDSG